MFKFLGRTLFQVANCWFPIVSSRQTESRSKLAHYSYKGANAIHGGFTLMTSSHPSYLPKTPPPNIIALWVRFQHTDFGGTQTFGPHFSSLSAVDESLGQTYTAWRLLIIGFKLYSIMYETFNNCSQNGFPAPRFLPLWLLHPEPSL